MFGFKLFKNNMEQEENLDDKKILEMIENRESQNRALLKLVKFIEMDRNTLTNQVDVSKVLLKLENSETDNNQE